MISRDIGVVICRVGAVLLLAQAIQAGAYTLNAFEQSGLGISTFLTSASMVLAGPILGALGLWFFAQRICSFGASHTNGAQSTEAPDFEKSDLVSAGTYLLGVYVLVYAIVDVVQIAAMSMYPRLHADTAAVVDDVSNSHDFARHVGNGAQMLLGIALIIVGRWPGRRSIND